MSSTPPEEGAEAASDGSDIIPAPVIEAVLGQVPEEYRAEALLKLTRYVEQHSGPVPSAREMARYKEIDPSFPKRFVKQLELQSDHRRSLERKVVDDDYKVKSRGQHYALISVVLCLGFALALALIGATTAAAVVGGTTVLGIVTIFVTGRAFKQTEKAEAD